MRDDAIGIVFFKLVYVDWEQAPNYLRSNRTPITEFLVLGHLVAVAGEGWIGVRFSSIEFRSTQHKFNHKLWAQHNRYGGY